jgi:hypothetical protein
MALNWRSHVLSLALSWLSCEFEVGVDAMLFLLVGRSIKFVVVGDESGAVLWILQARLIWRWCAMGIWDAPVTPWSKDA